MTTPHSSVSPASRPPSADDAQASTVPPPFAVGQRVVANRDITSTMLNTVFGGDDVRVREGDTGTIEGTSYAEGFDWYVNFGAHRWCVLAAWLSPLPSPADERADTTTATLADIIEMLTVLKDFPHDDPALDRWYTGYAAGLQRAIDTVKDFERKTGVVPQPAPVVSEPDDAANYDGLRLDQLRKGNGS